jgi:hypothetical protein
MGQNNRVLPGVAVNEVGAGIPGSPGARALLGALIGKFADGDENEFTLCSSENVLRDFGGLVFGSAAFDAAEYFKRGPNLLWVCRVKGTASSVTVKDQQTPTPADKMKVEAKVDGTWADYAAGPPAAGVLATVAAGTLTGTFKLTITAYYTEKDGSESTTEVFDNLSLDDESPRYFGTYVTAVSKIVTVTDLAPASQAEANLPATGDKALAGGAEPDYDDGITALDSVRGRVVLFTDQDDDEVNTALIEAIVARSQSDGAGTISADAGIVALNAPQYTAVADLASYATGITEPRAKVMGPWLLLRDSLVNASRYMRPAAIYAGLRAKVEEYHSCLNRYVTGVLGVELDLTRGDLTTLLQAGCQLIYAWPDDESRGMRVLNDIQADGSDTFVRLTRDKDAAAHLARLGWVPGQHQGETDPDPTRIAAKGTMAAYYDDLLARGVVERYTVKCDAENNTAETIAAKELHVRTEAKYRDVVETVSVDLTVGTESAIARAD